MREALRDPGRLEHILTAIDNVMSFVKGKTIADLKKDKILWFGTVKCVEIVGEASYMLSQAFKENHPETPWKDVIAFRHAMVHGYYNMDVTEIWNVIQNDLPLLREQVAGYLKEY